MLFMGFVAYFHALSHSDVCFVLSVCALEKEMSWSFAAGPKPMRRQSAAALMSVPLRE